MSRTRASVKELGPQIFRQGDGDAHPVETFSDASAQTGSIVNIPVDLITPNPEQPRKYFEPKSLEELSESIRVRGLLQPIIVARMGDSYLLVAGERRYRASKLAGLTKIPCLVRSDDPLEIAIIENLQREDLNAVEEAEGLQALADKFKYTHEQLAGVVGKSRPTVTEILSINRLPKPIREECRTSDIASKSLLLQLVRLPDATTIQSTWEQIKKGGLTVKAARVIRKPESEKKPTHFQHLYTDPGKRYRVSVIFERKQVSKADVQEALKAALKAVDKD
jgi:ParB family chromosome partitioning protein